MAIADVSKLDIEQNCGSFYHCSFLYINDLVGNMVSLNR